MDSMTELTPLPPTGIWEVSNADYHAETRLLSNSTKECFRRSKKLYYQTFVTKELPPAKPTEAKKFGTQFHMAVLEPELFRESYYQEPDVGDRRKKVAKDALAELALNNPGREGIKHEHWLKLQRMRDAVLATAESRKVIEHLGPVEQSLVWTCPETGLACKCRRDKVLTGRDTVVDIKTTEDASPEGFKVAACRYGLHRNADWYQGGHHEVFGAELRYLFLLVSKTTYECALYELDNESLNKASVDNLRIKRDLAECFATNNWVSRHEMQVTLVRLPQHYLDLADLLESDDE